MLAPAVQVPPGHISSVGVSADGRQLAVGYYVSATKVELYEVCESDPAGPPHHVRTFTFTTNVYGVAFGPEGNGALWVACADVDRVFELDVGGSVRRVLACPGGPLALAIHPDGDQLAVGCGYQGLPTPVRLLRGSDDTLACGAGMADYAAGVTFVRGGARVLATDGQGVLHLLCARTGAGLGRFRLPGADCTPAALYAVGPLVAAADPTHHRLLLFQLREDEDEEVVAVRGFHSQEVPGVRYPCAVGGGGGGGGGRHPPLLYVADAGSAVGDCSTDTVVAVKSPWASSSL